MVGGQGTGKTTVLRGLSYEGQYAINKQDNSTIKDWEYFGIYYRVDTNRVSAFQGNELTEIEWIRRFAHYINLLMCTHIVRFLAWFQSHTNYNTELDFAARERIANTLNIRVPSTNENLLEMLQTELTIFENHINNVASTKGPNLSMQGAPIQILLESVEKNAIFRGKHFFFLIDEYENLRDYQQKLMNTLIKHSGELFSFKVGVREFGWRIHTTLNETEQLISPADYTRIDINNVPDFELLAYRVCQDRLNHVIKDNQNDIKHLLPGLSEEKRGSTFRHWQNYS